MKPDPAQLALDLAEPDLGASPRARHAPTIAGLSWSQLGGGALLLCALIWSVWTTHELLALKRHRIVTVKLAGLINQFALAEARSGDDPEHAAARTKAYLGALDAALKARANRGEMVLVGEAVVSASVDDITDMLARQVGKVVTMPVAQALPARMAVPQVAQTTPVGSPFAGEAQAEAPPPATASMVGIGQP